MVESAGYIYNSNVPKGETVGKQRFYHNWRKYPVIA